MDLQNLDNVSIKTELGPQEEDANEMPYSDTEIDPPDLKKECLQYVESNPTANNSHMETITIRTEPGPREECGKIIPCTEIDLDLADVKKECFERSERITQISDSLTNLITDPGKKGRSCPHCYCFCSDKEMLELHLRTHTVYKPFSCSDCNYTCSKKGNFNRHLLTHSEEKPFACSDCKYSCVRKESLITHRMTHSGEKPFTCIDCNYSCSTNGNLKTHMLTHGEDKLFTCSDCKYSYSTKGGLKRHLLIHPGDHNPGSTKRVNRVGENPLRLTARHFLSDVPQSANSKRKTVYRECYVCKHSTLNPKRRVQTRYWCSPCDVPLCPTTCFKIYHTVQNF